MIKKVPLFSDLNDRELRQIAQSMKERTFGAGDVVTEEGKGGVGFFVIEDGTANVQVSDLRCYGMTFWDFRPLVEGNSSIAWKLLQAMAQRLKQSEQR